MNARSSLGRAGEDAACEFLHARGYRIVDRNYRCALGELDVVARRGDVLVFCEVKTRSSARFGLPAEAVDYRKQTRLRRLAAMWLAERDAGRCQVRFDVVSVVVEPQGPRVTHIPGAF